MVAVGGDGCLGKKYCEGSKCSVEHSSNEVSWVCMWWDFSFFHVFSDTSVLLTISGSNQVLLNYPTFVTLQLTLTSVVKAAVTKHVYCILLD